MGTDQTRLAHLGRLIRGRRGYLGLDIEPAARQQRMSKDTWKKVERGAAIERTSVYGRIEQVLGWPPGSILGYLDGGPEPAPRDEPAAQDPLVIYVNSEQERRAVEALLDALRSAQPGEDTRSAG